MIPLSLAAVAEAERPYITRLRASRNHCADHRDSLLVESGADGATFAGQWGLLSLEGLNAGQLDGDVVLVEPAAGRVERILRAGSPHNTLLVTERCDQLCVMCSQPPKKTHHDRFDLFEEACMLAEPGSLIGVSGGEPTLYKEALLGMMERVLAERPDLGFHVLTNGQHFEQADIERLRSPLYRRVTWGIPLYSAEATLHDLIVAKPGAFERLERSFARLCLAGARVELRTVVLTSNVAALSETAGYVTSRLRFIEVWSIMQLEHIGFARNRWQKLYVDHRRDFAPIAEAIDLATLHGVSAQLFNFPRCTVPEPFRELAVASISDWKRKYAAVCEPCRERDQCCGYFEWHPCEQAEGAVRPI